MTDKKLIPVASPTPKPIAKPPAAPTRPDPVSPSIKSGDPSKIIRKSR